MPEDLAPLRSFCSSGVEHAEARATPCRSTPIVRPCSLSRRTPIVTESCARCPTRTTGGNATAKHGTEQKRVLRLGRHALAGSPGPGLRPPGRGGRREGIATTPNRPQCGGCGGTMHIQPDEQSARYTTCTCTVGLLKRTDRFSSQRDSPCGPASEPPAKLGDVGASSILRLTAHEVQTTLPRPPSTLPSPIPWANSTKFTVVEGHGAKEG